MIHMRYFFYRIFLCLYSIVLVSFPAIAADNILVIHSYHQEYKWTGLLKSGLDESFSSNNESRVFHEYMDAKRYPKNHHHQIFLDYLEKKYVDTNINLVMTTDDVALEFVLSHRSNALLSKPVVYMGVNRVTQGLLDNVTITGVFENRNIKQMILDIKLLSGVDELVVVSDKTSTGSANIIKAYAAAKLPDSPSRIHFIEELREENIKTTFADIKAHTPVLLLGQVVSSKYTGSLLDWSLTAEAIHRVVSNPLFTISLAALDHGVVGTDELDGRLHAKQAAELAKQVLSGALIAQIPPITEAQNQWTFYWPQLQKHKIKSIDLPFNSKIIKEDESFYYKYRYIVWFTLFVLLVAVLVILLLIEIIRRGNKTRAMLVENESRYKDLAHSGESIFWETDENFKLSYMSGDTQDSFGKSKGVILGATFEELCKENPDNEVPWSEYEMAISQLKPVDNLVFKTKLFGDDLKVFMINGKAIYDKNSRFKGYRGICKEITQEQNLSKQLAYQALYDPLTGLINRSSFNERVKDFVLQTCAATEQSFVCFLDLDSFKLVNDTAGHSVGDAMLAEVAKEIASCIGKKDILGRLGGDEFGLLLIDYNVAQAHSLCDAIINRVKKFRFHWNQRVLSSGVSIGMVPIAQNMNEIALLSKADLCCYKAKESGRGRVYIADVDNADLYEDELQMGFMANVGQAIEQDNFFLVKQLIQAAEPSVHDHPHFEILLRYRDEHGKVINPGAFIPAAEKHGVITLIDHWVLSTILDKYHEYFEDRKTIISVNLSGISLSNEQFIKDVVQLVKSSQVDPSRICFEITETSAISQMSHALKFMVEMKALGIKFALDDFGSGVSSFGYLKDLPVDYLKIDGSLVKNIATEPTDRAIVESINSIAHMMNMKTIAEFVENDDIAAVLKDIGVDYLQGYGIGRPQDC